jgi:hypothetical protein
MHSDAERRSENLTALPSKEGNVGMSLERKFFSLEESRWVHTGSSSKRVVKYSFSNFRGKPGFSLS